MNEDTELDFVIVTYTKDPFFYMKLLNHSLNYQIIREFKLVILDGSDESFKERINGDLKSTQEMVKDFSSYKNFFYKNYSNNGDYAKILSDYVYNLSLKSKYFSFVGDDDVFLDVSGFVEAQNFLTKFPSYSICNISRVDDIVGENKSGFTELEGVEYVKNFINLNLIDKESVTHVFNLRIIRAYKTLKFLNLRKKGLEDFYGFDIHLLFNTAVNGKVKYLDTKVGVKTAEQGNEIRYTVRYPLTQWLCYYIYSLLSLNSIRDKITTNEKRIFIAHWLNSFLICYSKFLFSSYDSKHEDYNKVRNYLRKPVFIYFIYQIIKNFIF
jgi:hypothetical protein